MLDLLHLRTTPARQPAQILILDEADRLLEVGFKEELDMIIRNCPQPRTTMLFSATMTGGSASIEYFSLRAVSFHAIKSNSVNSSHLSTSMLL